MRYAVALLTWLALVCVANAQALLLHAGQSPKVAVSCSSYIGPGDIVSWKSYWSLRSYSCVTRGNKLVNVCNSTGGIDVGCADISSDPTTGALVSATIALITCPGTNCTIKTFYDVS